MSWKSVGPGGLLIPETAAPATPASGWGGLYVATDGTLHIKNDAGVDQQISGNDYGTIWNNTDHFTVGAGTSAANQAINGFYAVPVKVMAPCSLTGIRYRKGAGTTAANVIGALYDATGARIAVSGTVAQGTTANAKITLPFGSVYSALPAKYWLGWIGSATAADYWGAVIATYMGPAYYALQGSFATPASFTPPADTSTPTSVNVPNLFTY